MSKASKHLRDCPAAGRAITSRECGEGRHSVFKCPAVCPHNPLSAANYDQFGEMPAIFTFLAAATDALDRMVIEVR